MKQIRSHFTFAKSVAMAVGLVGALSLAGTASATDKLVLATPSPTSISYAPWAMAYEMGFFKEEGLELDIVRIDGSGTLIPQVATKGVDIGWPNPDIVIVSAQPGRDTLPVKFFYNHLVQSVWEVIVPANSDIKTIEQLRGKKLGVSRLSSGSIPLLQAILHESGIDEKKDLELVPVGFGGPAFRAIKSKQIDALFLFDIMHEILQNTGYPIRRLAISDKQLNLMGNGMLASNDVIKNKGKQLAAFGRAVTKGAIACHANPGACVRMYWKHYPSKKPTKGSEADNIKKNVAMLKARFPKMLPDPSSRRIGAYEPGPWKDFVSVLHETGKIKTTNIPVQDLYTNEFVPAFNDFDRAAVIAAAKALN